MGSQSPRLDVILTPTAKEDLNQIWLWNATHHHKEWADRFEEFLLGKLEMLEDSYPGGRLVLLARNYQYTIVRKAREGTGTMWFTK